jgi:hypothetical protein
MTMMTLWMQFFNTVLGEELHSAQSVFLTVILAPWR